MLYVVATNRSSAETEVIRTVQPPRLLLSYFYFRTNPLAAYVDKIGYTPEIMLDSGAFSAFTTGRNIAIIDYIKYIKDNAALVTHYIALDVIGDAALTKAYYDIMVSKGLRPIPVYHYQDKDDEGYLKYYIAQGCKYIALGGTVPIKDKQLVYTWIKYLKERYPGTTFHVLGSSSKVVHEALSGLDTADSASWIKQAINGSPKHIPGNTTDAKIKRAAWNLTNIV